MILAGERATHALARIGRKRVRLKRSMRRGVAFCGAHASEHLFQQAQLFQIARAPDAAAQVKRETRPFRYA